MILIPTNDITLAIHSREFVMAVRDRMWSYMHWRTSTAYRQLPSYTMPGAAYVVTGETAQPYVKADLKADGMYILHEGFMSPGYLVATEIM